MRPDGRRLKHSETNLMYTVAPYFMPHRYDSMNMIELDIPEAPLHEYINRRRAEGRNISHLTIFIAAYVRTVCEFPQLNRFIMNRKIYARNDISVGMVVLKPGHDDGTMNKVCFDWEDTLDEVDRKLSEYIEENRKEGDTNKTDKAMNVLLNIPGLISFGTSIIRWLDKHNLLPGSLIKASPFHEGLVITNLASIRANHIYHHIYEFGTVGQIMALGSLRDVPKKGKNGEILLERCIPIGVVMDERICGGCYYTQAFARMKQYLKNPALLEQKPDPDKVIKEYIKPKKTK